MISALAPLLLFQIALVSPVATPGMGDVLPPLIGAWHAAAPPARFAGSEAKAFAASPSGGSARGSSNDAEAAILREFGFVGGQRRDYVQGDRTMTVEAMRIHDPSGAFGVFTWYRQPGWRELNSPAASGKRYQAAIGPGEAVLQRNGFVVRVLHYEPTPQELVALAAAMPTYSNEPLPEIADFLPPSGIVKGSAKYAFGPAMFGKLAPQVPPAALGFPMGAEAVSAEYRLPGRSPMTLVMAMYPTPQLAQKYAKEIAALNVPGVELRRTGSMLFFVPDAPHKADAEKLLSSVHFGMEVMMNENVPKVTVKSFSRMIMSIFVLCAIVLGFCALSGVLYGLIRVLTRRIYPGQVFDRDIEVIELHLSR